MNYQIGDLCYADIALARSAYAAKFEPRVVDFGAGCSGMPVVTGSATGFNVNWSRVSGSCTMPVGTAVTYTPQACALYTPADAAAMSWGVIAAWLAAYVLGRLLPRAAE